MQAFIERLQRRVLMMIGRGPITATDDSGAVQTAQVQLSGLETRDRTPVLYHYGFTSNPIPGARGVVAFVGGDRSNGVVIATGDQRFRMTGLQSGEVALYTDEGDRIHFQRGRIARIVAGTRLVIDSPLTVFTGAIAHGNADGSTGGTLRLTADLLQVTGDIIDHGDSNASTVQTIRQVFDAHTHPDPQGGNTSPPNPPAL